MDTLLTTLATTIGAEAMKTWGVFAIVLMLLGLRLWHQAQELKAEKIASSDLRKQVSDLQERRIEDARALVRVTESSTATTIARTQGDQQLRQILSEVLDVAAELRQNSPANRRSRRPFLSNAETETEDRRET